MKHFILETIFIVILPILLMSTIPLVFQYRHLIIILMGVYAFIHRDSFAIPKLHHQLKLPTTLQFYKAAIFTLISIGITLFVHINNPELISQMIKIVLPSSIPPVITAITYALISVPLQELIFRWIYINRLKQVFRNTSTIVVISALVFAAAHIPFGSPIMVIGTLIAGLWWGYDYINHKTLILPVFSHAVVGTLLIILWIN